MDSSALKERKATAISRKDPCLAHPIATMSKLTPPVFCRRHGLAGSLITVAILMACALPICALHAAPAFVQGAANEIRSGTTNSRAFPNANTAGNLIVAYVVWTNTGTVTLSDSKGNSYASVAAPTRWNSNTWSAQVFYARNVSGGANTVTATFSNAITSWGILYIHEYSGMNKLSPLDVSSSAAGSSSAMNSGSITTTNANNLIFGAGSSSNTVTQAGTGFTTRSTAYGNRTQDRNVTTTGTYNATATQNSFAWVMHMVAFKADSGTGDSTPPSVPTAS